MGVIISTSIMNKFMKQIDMTFIQFLDFFLIFYMKKKVWKEKIYKVKRVYCKRFNFIKIMREKNTNTKLVICKCVDI